MRSHEKKTRGSFFHYSCETLFKVHQSYKSMWAHVCSICLRYNKRQGEPIQILNFDPDYCFIVTNRYFIKLKHLKLVKWETISNVTLHFYWVQGNVSSCNTSKEIKPLIAEHVNFYKIKILYFLNSSTHFLEVVEF